MSITSRNAGTLSTYELRQELIRRNALDIEESKINHRNMLERLMVELVREERENRVYFSFNISFVTLIR